MTRRGVIVAAVVMAAAGGCSSEDERATANPPEMSSTTTLPVASAAPTSTTTAPAVASSASSGVPTRAPTQPPASTTSSAASESWSAPSRTWSSPRVESATTPHPIASWTGLAERPRRTNETPTAASITGRAKRPYPNSQPARVSMPRPSGPARSTYTASARTIARPIDARPMNSCSRPPIADRSGDSATSSPPGGVASRTVPEAFLAPLAFPGADFDDLVPDEFERDEAPDFRDADAERFLDGPQVLMACSTVLGGCHHRPRPLGRRLA